MLEYSNRGILVTIVSGFLLDLTWFSLISCSDLYNFFNLNFILQAVTVILDVVF